jgi:hypothetical protein
MPSGRLPRLCDRCARPRPMVTRAPSARDRPCEHRQHHLAIDFRAVVAAVLGDAEQDRRHRLRARAGLRIGEAEIVLHQRIGVGADSFSRRRRRGRRLRAKRGCCG